MSDIPDMNNILDSVTRMLVGSLRQLDPGDRVDYNVSMQFLPSDTAIVPTLFLFAMVAPVEGADGSHMAQVVSPYAVTQELVDFYVHEWAGQTVKLRRAIRERVRADERRTTGVAVPDEVV